MTVTIIQAGTQHNVVPVQCNFTIDVRSTDTWSNEEILEVLRQKLKSEVKPRSMRLKSSRISVEHPFVVVGKNFISLTPSILHSLCKS
jgi:acetylornithine deacetylase